MRNLEAKINHDVRMTDCFHIKLSDSEIGAFSSLSLAHIGDAVYGLLVQTRLCKDGCRSSPMLHRELVRHVAAPAQARAARLLRPMLTEKEESVYKRGRNARVNSVPRNANLAEYHAATGLEALFGWLYLRDERQRISELFDFIMEETSDAS